MRRKGWALIAGMILIALTCAGCAAGGEGGQTETAAWFNAEVLPKLIDTGVNVLLIVGLIGASFRKIRTAAASFTTVKETLVANEAKRVAGEASVSKREQRVERAEEEIAALKASVDDLKKQTDKLLEICTVAYANDPYLVSNGYAEEIMKVVKDETSEPEE